MLWSVRGGTPHAEDHACLVTLPEWAQCVLVPATHGDTNAEALQGGQEVLKMLIESAKAASEPLPPPKLFAAGERAA